MTKPKIELISSGKQNIRAIYVIMNPVEIITQNDKITRLMMLMRVGRLTLLLSSRHFFPAYHPPCVVLTAFLALPCLFYSALLHCCSRRAFVWFSAPRSWLCVLIHRDIERGYLRTAPSFFGGCFSGWL